MYKSEQVTVLKAHDAMYKDHARRHNLSYPDAVTDLNKRSPVVGLSYQLAQRGIEVKHGN